MRKQEKGHSQTINKFKLTMESNSYYNLPRFIERLRSQRENAQDSNINFTIILLSTTIIESVLHDLLNLTIGDEFDLDTIGGRIANDLSIKINKASFTEFNNLSRLIFNRNVNDCVDNEMWKSIQALYDYRNHIMHGKSFIIERNEMGDGYEYKGKLKKVFDFLLEKGVIESERPGVLTSKIADFFWSITKDFVLTLAKEFHNDENDIVLQMLSDTLNYNTIK